MYRRRTDHGLVAVLTILTIWGICIWGWVWNIVKLVGMTWTGNEGMFVARVVGIFTGPVGSVLGFL